MNLNQITEKAVAERMGALMLENAKLQALLASANTEIVSLRARVSKLEKPKTNGADGDEHHSESAELS